MKKLCTVFLLIFLIPIYSQSGSVPTKNKIIIGLKDAPPFVIKTDAGYSGVSVDLWNEIANSLNIEYEYRYYNLPDLLDAIKNNEVDLSINPLTVTAERMQKFSFTQPYYITNLGIATKPQGDGDFLTFLKNIFSMNFIKAVFLLLLIIFVFGFVLWMVERKRNSDQFHRGAKGIGDGVWWSAVTMTTVGYGDKAPRTAVGRVISFIWMFTAIIVISSFTAGIASSLTINQLESSIHGIDDLKKVKVGTISESASAEFLKKYGVIFHEYHDIKKGLEDVDHGVIKAFVYDEAILRYLVHLMKLHERVLIIPSSYSKEYFSFASNNEELLKKINPLLMQFIETPGYKDILEDYNLDYQE